MRKLVTNLKDVMNWEAFGYLLLPEKEERLVKVWLIIYIACSTKSFNAICKYTFKISCIAKT